MSVTLSTTQMVARLQRKFPLGLGVNDCMDFLNEAFRKIDQFSKAGFIWQVYTQVLTAPAGVLQEIQLPVTYDPGKSAWLRSQSGVPTLTVIPYKSYNEFYNQQHFGTATIGQFSCWTHRPAANLGVYEWWLRLAPATAYPLPAPVLLDLTYHRMQTPQLAVGPAVYFPTPDQFDSLIIDIAEAELARVYQRAGWEKIQSNAMQGVAELIDTYRTDKYDLAGLSDLVLQAQERQADKAK